MESKTPQFDALLDEILEKLVPHKRICKWNGEHQYCEREFDITKEDIEFLKLLRAPAPNYCPTCRRIRRFNNMGWSQLFKKKCNAPGHTESMISIFSEACPFPVYDYKYFADDEFDPFSFGIKYEEMKSPMTTLLNFRKKFPVPSFLNRDPSSINSEYSNGGRNLKNGYYVMACYHVEDAWYSLMINKSRNVMDSYTIIDSEFVYGSVNSDHLYKSSFVYFSSNCTDSNFLFDCRNCMDCFGCVNLRNARYCVYNKQLTKEDYESFIDSITPFSRNILKECSEKFWQLVKSLPLNGPRIISSNDVVGAKIINSRKLFNVTDGVNSENIRHADGALSHKDSMDILYSGGHSSLLYMCTNIGSQSSRVKFSISSKFCVNCEFVFNSKNLNNCFMCFGLQNKSYCILNKQYEEKEYFKIIDEIKTTMLQIGEYSDGPGFEFSPQAYNFSIGQILYPLNEEQIKKFGGYIAEEPETNVGDIEILKKDQIPQTINEVTDDILNKAISCEITNRPFKIIPSELSFLRRMGLPLPVTHPSVRMSSRWKISPVGKKYQTKCKKCDKDMETLFDPEENYIMYCEKCYQQEVC
jgi:hypothetical protein